MSDPIKYPCPHCQTRKVETVATAPYIRGFLLAYQYGSKTFVGCVPCVRKKVAGEAGLSALIGWYSISAVFVNPFLILYNLIQLPFIRINYDKARAKLETAGVPDDRDAVDLTEVGYALAAAMIAVDGTCAPAEIARTQELGATLLRGFDPKRFEAVLAAVKQLPPIQGTAGALADALDDDGKQAFFNFLLAIAQSDGSANESEMQLLTDIAQHMRYTPVAVTA